MFLLPLVPAAAQAAAGSWVENDQSRLRLLSAADGIGETGELRLGLQIELAEGWKTYWRSPGDAGFPVSVDWSGSQNLGEVDFRWPVPHRFTLFGLDTFGYGGEVIFPVAAKAADPARPLQLKAQVDYLVCEEICVPHSETLSLELPPGPAAPAREAFLIDRFGSRVPDTGGRSGLSLEEVGLAEGEAGTLLVARVASAIPLSAPDLLVEAGDGGPRFGAPRVELAEDRRSAVLRLPVSFDARGRRDLAGEAATLTLVDGARGLERRLALAPLPPDSRLAETPAETPVETGGRLRTLLPILGLGLLGGLILNLMPCVLPVLSIKLLSAVGHGGREAGAVRLSFLASAAGILASFLLLAGAAIAVKAAGLAVGWGIQFQQPLFLAAMALLVTLFALNLFGFFEVPLPGWLGGVAAKGDGHSLAGHFLTGAFATLLATPCSAPFLGTAVGFALSRGAPEILAVFTALGLGLALPYLLVAAAPALATRLPRPGPWMVTLRRLLGLALAGTALWLVSVLAAQRGWQAALAVLLLLTLLGVLVALRRRLPRPAVPLGAALLGGLLLIVAGWPGALPESRKVEAASEAVWRPLDPETIPELVAAGKVVFVDVTADWCITCQVNKALVLDDPEVIEALGGEEVVRLRGDWTRPDPDIAAYLARFGRYGIPFNAVYGPAVPEGRPLSELLTVQAVLTALGEAGGTGQAASR